MIEPILLEMRGIHKQFPGVYALNNVAFELRRGEVHALLGENGAGKSTLIKILAGVHSANEGEILVKGRPVNLDSVHTANAYGISVIHQELCLVPEMTVAENIFLGREFQTSFWKMVDYRQINERARKILALCGPELQPEAKVSDLSIAEQQMVEIAKALSINADIIVMDEPTASLTNKEVGLLFKIIKELKEKKMGIIYISHRMEELFEITDRITVLRDGKYIGTRETRNTHREELIGLMVGRELGELYQRNYQETSDVVLEVQNLAKKGVLQDISFTLKRGEILGFAGLVGAGRSELAQVIFGIETFDSGRIYIEQKPVEITSPSVAMSHRIALVPENRKEQGLVLIKSISYNITLTVLKQFVKFIKTDHQKEFNLVHDYVERLGIKTPSIDQQVGNLSGGNQQKVVLAKWLATKPRVLILDEPTRGVDIGAKAEIYALINALAAEGVGIIMISSELPEVINMSDRIMVMHKGSIAGSLIRDEFDQERIMHYATGGN